MPQSLNSVKQAAKAIGNEVREEWLFLFLNSLYHYIVILKSPDYSNF